VVAIYTGINGWLDSVPVGQVPRFHDELREHLKTEGTIYAAIRESGDLSDETAGKLVKELEHFQGVFNVAEEKGLAG
jgi:F-type H+-transporting ATPase subunit alpha